MFESKISINFPKNDKTKKYLKLVIIKFFTLKFPKFKLGKDINTANKRIINQ